MGARKRIKAQERKEANKQKAFASLKDCPTSPRKMRLVVDLIRGKEVNKALDILQFTQKEAARRVEKLLMSAISNWQNKNQGARIEEAGLYVKEAYVDSARMLKGETSTARTCISNSQAFKSCYNRIGQP